jgi:paraquat-inducible protein B
MTEARPALVGGFILSGLALGVAAILLFGGTHLFSPTVHAVVYFSGSVANLDVGAPVTFRGVRVGTVTAVKVTLDMTDLTARIPVYLDLVPSQIFLENGSSGNTDSGFERLLKAGLRAQLNMQSLVTGKLRIDLDLQPGVPTVTYGSLKGRPEIPSIPSKLQTLEGEISELPLKEIIENARHALAAIQDMAVIFPALIRPLAASLTQTSEAAHVAVVNLDQLAIASRHQVGVTGDQLARVLTTSDRVLHDTEGLVASLKEVSDRNSPMREDLQAAIRDLSASAGSLRSFTREIERDPSLLLKGRPGQ